MNEISPERAAFLAGDYCRGFIRYCRIEPEEIKRGYFQSRVIIGEDHRQQDGFIHAGVMATMADHTAGYAAFTLAPEDRQILTIEFKINFLRPAFGESLSCRSRIIREGSQILIAESEVFDKRGQDEVMAAKAMVTLMSVPKEKLLSKD
ncbi:MAG: PaaI family thioesterase [Desulfobacteraceae bacterium]|jgi:uncharacterized protein (TIGR00369 family)|nr:MAG: PaaI family thioesterase [Desulfobacteraceae bacterium]